VRLTTCRNIFWSSKDSQLVVCNIEKMFAKLFLLKNVQQWRVMGLFFGAEWLAGHLSHALSWRHLFNDYVMALQRVIAYSHIGMESVFVCSVSRLRGGRRRASKCCTAAMLLTVHIRSWLFSEKSRHQYHTSWSTRWRSSQNRQHWLVGCHTLLDTRISKVRTVC